MVSKSDEITAEKQFIQFQVKGYAAIKWMLKYVVIKGKIRIYDYGRTWAQFYSEFTKRTDTIMIFFQAIIESSYDFIFKLRESPDARAGTVSGDMLLRLKGFIRAFKEYIIPLTNNKELKPIKIWLKMEGLFNACWDLEQIGRPVKSMDDPEFELKWMRISQNTHKIPMVDSMAKDLRDIDRRLNKKGSLSEGGYYAHENAPINTGYDKRKGYGKPYFPRNKNPNYQQYQYPHHLRDRYNDNRRGGKRSRGRGRRGGYNNYSKQHNYHSNNDRAGRNRSRSRSRDRDQDKNKSRILPDFPEGYDNNWDRKKSYYSYKNGVYYGDSKLENSHSQIIIEIDHIDKSTNISYHGLPEMNIHPSNKKE